METGDYETNTLLINNIVSVAFRIYEPAPEHSQSFHSAALEVEAVARDQGKIVSYDSTRRGIWVFQVTAKDSTEDVAGNRSTSTLEVRGHTLSLQEEGSFEPASLQKNRPLGNASLTSSQGSASVTPGLDPSQRNSFITSAQTPAANSLDADVRVTTSLTNGAKEGQMSLKTVYERFVTALLSTISTSFCSKSSAIPLNYRTVLLPSPAAADRQHSSSSSTYPPIISTFRIYMTTTGSIVVNLLFSCCSSLSSLEDAMASKVPVANRPVLAAPLGAIATKQGATSGETGMATDTSLSQTPNTQVLNLRGWSDTRDSPWKQSCSKVLQLRGLDTSILKGCLWAPLVVTKPVASDAENEARRLHITVPWPAPLCFSKKPVEVLTTSRLGDTMLNGHDEYHDPLGSARGWLTTATERDEKITRRKADRASAMSKEANTSDNQSQKPNGQSPLVLRRPSTAAAGVIYPTPPDALQQHLGVTPSIDGTISSPGNPPPTAAIVDIDTTMANTNPLSDGNAEDWDGADEPKRNRSDSNLLADSDNVFGDLGGDDFGEHAITEDDFDFFDGPNNDEPDDLAMPDIEPNQLPVAPQPPIKVEQAPAQSTEAEPAPKPTTKADDAVFTKPELKHARSCLNDEQYQRSKLEKPAPTKREPSPFDPDAVFKRVRALLANPDGNQPTSQEHPRKNSIFQKVDFDPTLPLINKKYEQGGTFDFGQSNAKFQGEATKFSDDGLAKRQAKPTKLKELPLPTASLIRPFNGIEVPASQPSPTKPSGYALGSDSSDADSDDDDPSDSTEDPISPIKSSLKRTVLDDDVMSNATSLREGDMLDERNEDQLAGDLPRLSQPELPEVSLLRFFSDPEPLAIDTGLSDEDLVQVAQLITDQASSGFLEIGTDAKSAPKSSLDVMRVQEMEVARNSLQILQSTILSLFDGVATTRLKGFLDVADVPLAGQPNRLQPRPVPGRDPNAEQLRANNLYQIPGPHLEVRRSETKLSVLPSSVSFWESLGLAPSSGTKDIDALCVFPGWKGMADHIGTFLSSLKSVYESLKLGSFNNMALSGDLDAGILPYEVDRISTSPDATVTGHGSALVECLETLRTVLAESTAREKNFVLYFVYSPDNPSSIIESCTAFQRCFDLYRKSLASRRETPRNELVLQLVPLDFLSSPTALVTPPLADLARLCLETYDRCTLFLGPDFGGPTSAPAIMLEQPLPRIIDFKLTNSPSASLMHENSCIHVAYAQSIDERWVTAAWTDNRGHQQATASYCLGRKDKPLSTSMQEVAHEIWESTLDLISVWKVHWRVIITKSGPMDQQEMEFWVDLARTECVASVTMILMTVDTKPSLQLIPPAVKVPHLATSTFYSTPVSTPQANIVSPEQTNTPATPMRDAGAAAATPGADSPGEPDSDSFLIDATDQTWGAVAGHRLSNSTSLLEIRPALVSGYLIKRTGVRMEDPPAIMEVNLVYTEATARAYEPLLREMLSYFRSLGTLARARGMVYRESDVRPWHIAAAEKGVRALYLLL